MLKLNEFNFSLLAFLIIVSGGLFIGIYLSEIQTWQFNQIDKFIHEARRADTRSQSYNLTQQAAVIGFNDPVAIENKANFLIKNGELNLALKTYQFAPIRINPVYLGYLALKIDQSTIAKIQFELANKQEETAESLAGLAIIEFINNRINSGCELATKASKLDLSNKRAEQVNIICDILQNKSQLSSRHQAYILIRNYLYKEGETKLEKIEAKSAIDYLVLAKVKALEGNLKASEDLIKKGLALDPTNLELLKFQLTILSRQEKDLQKIQSLIEELEFRKSQQLP